MPRISIDHYIAFFVAFLGRFNTLNIQSGNPAWCPAALQALGGPKSREKIGPILPKKKKKKKKKKEQFFSEQLCQKPKIQQPSGHPHGIGFPTVMFKNFPLGKTSVMTIEGERGFLGGVLSILLTQNNIVNIDQKSIAHTTSFSCPHFDFLHASNDMIWKTASLFS